MNLLGFVLICMGFIRLALGMERHRKQIFSEGRAPTLVLSVIFLVTSFIPEVLHYGWAIGISVWFGMATFAVILIGLVLTYRPRVLRCFLRR